MKKQSEKFRKGKLIDIDKISRKTHFSPIIVNRILTELSKQGVVEIVK